MNHIKRALWRIFIVVVMLIAVPVLTAVAILELAVGLLQCSYVYTGEWWRDLCDHTVECVSSAWLSFRKGKRLDGTER